MVIRNLTQTADLATLQEQLEQLISQYGMLLPVAEAARASGIPLPTLSDAVRNGRLPSIRVFGRAIVRMSDVRAYASKEHKGSPQKSLSQAFAEIAANITTDVPADLSINMDKYLYQLDVPGAE